MNKNLIKLSSFYYNKKDIPVTKRKVKTLIRESYLYINVINNETYFYYDDLLNIVNIEKDLSENYLSSDDFLQVVCKSTSTTSYRKQIYEILSKCNLIYKIKTVNYRNSLFFNKYDVQGFIDNVYNRKEILRKLNINIYIYERIVCTKNLNIVRISKNVEYISKSDFSKFKTLSQEYSSKERKAIWIKGTTIINSNIFSKLVKKNETLYKLCQKNSIKHFKNRDKILYVKYRSLTSFYRKYINLSKNYYTFTEMRKVFGMTKTSITNFKTTLIPNLFKMCDTIGYEYFKTGQQLWGDNIYFKKEHIDEFLFNHISNNEVISKYDISYNQFNFLINFNNIKPIKLHTKLTFYERKQISELFKKESSKLYLGDNQNFYTKKQTLQLLNLSDSDFFTVRKEDQLTFYFFHNTTYYKKSEINNLLKINKEITEKYVSSSLVSETLGEHYFKHFKKSKKPKGIERYSFNKDSRTFLLFPKTEYEYLLKQKEHQKQLDLVSYDDPLSAFYELLEINSINFHVKSTITQQYWFEYCTDSILYNNKSKEIVPYFINSLVKCTGILSNFIIDSELHLKTSNEINLGLLNSDIAINHRNILRSFINKLYYELIRDNIKSLFNVEKINKSFKSNHPITHDKDMYDYDTFKKVYSYANNLKHKVLAINDGIIRISPTTSSISYDYSYTWLYILLHLSNAWRHRDICNLKMIDISFLNIKSLESFKSKNLTDDEVDKIINLLLTKEYTVSKTNVTNNLFISDDIRVAVANAYVICHLINQHCYPALDNIINFNNKHNNFLETHNNNFFKNFSANFIFKNRKMNRTLLTIMYTLLNKEKHNGAALNVAQRMRSHKSKESTNVYIKIPEDDINELSINLFNRGIFGYIPKILSEIIYGNTIDMTKETNNIIKIKKIFNDIYNIEATAGFLNNIVKQKESIMEFFINKETEEVFDTLNKLHKNLLPGKDDNFQCIVSEEGCLNTGLDCKNCVYAVPNFYAIANIVSSVTNTLNNFNNEFFKSKFEVEKIKKVNLLFMELDILHEAIIKFGEDVILEFFEGGKQEYINLLDLLDDVNSDKPIHEYSTYTPKGVK